MTKTLDLEVVGLVPSPGSPSLPSLPSVTSPADPVADRVLTYHRGFLSAFARQTGYAFLIGLELNAKKEQLPHGQFTKWRELNLPSLSNGSLHRYMDFASALQSKFPTVGNLTSERLLLTNGDLAESDQEAVLNAVKAATDGATLTELYRELGVIRSPKRQTYTPPRDLTPEQLLAAEKADALEHLNTAIATLDFIDATLLGKIPRPDRHRLLDALTDKSKLIRSLGKKSSSPTSSEPLSKARRKPIKHKKGTS